MLIAFRLLLVVVVNGIVIYGIGWAEWNGATALAVYWIETIVGGLLGAARIWLHRRWTRKKGHYRAQLGVTVGGEGNAKPINSFFVEYLTLIIVFSVGHAVFLGFFLYGILKQHPDPVLLKQGALAVVLCQIVGFLADLSTLHTMPFAVLKRMAGASAGRVVLIQFAIIGGMFLAAMSNRNENFLIPFAILKLLADVAGAFSSLPQRKTAPRWMVRLINWIWPKTDFEQYLAAEAIKDEKQEAQDEEVMPEPAPKKKR